jgi:hypothetical protein
VSNKFFPIETINSDDLESKDACDRLVGSATESAEGTAREIMVMCSSVGSKDKSQGSIEHEWSSTKEEAVEYLVARHGKCRIEVEQVSKQTPLRHETKGEENVLVANEEQVVKLEKFASGRYYDAAAHSELDSIAEESAESMKAKDARATEVKTSAAVQECVHDTLSRTLEEGKEPDITLDEAKPESKGEKPSRVSTIETRPIKIKSLFVGQFNPESAEADCNANNDVEL